jgi:hypothetical protein
VKDEYRMKGLERKGSKLIARESISQAKAERLTKKNLYGRLR